jgi:RNA polymerase primary sigma factor
MLARFLLYYKQAFLGLGDKLREDFMNKLSFETQVNEVYLSYVACVKKIPLLSEKEETDMACRASSGDKVAAQRLVEANLRLVIRIGQRYASPDIPLMDIIQEGNMGLMRAVEKFDLNRNVRFANYASLWIKQAIIRFISSKYREIKLPIKKEELLHKIHITKTLLHQKLGRAPKIDEIANEVGCSISDIEITTNLASAPLSLEAEIDSNSDSITGFCEDGHSHDPEREFMTRAARKDTRRFLKTYLSARERTVILHRFHFVDSETCTFQKLGATMGISAEAVRQIEKRALKKINQQRDELRDCVYA